jgi:hypothetical protein
MMGKMVQDRTLRNLDISFVSTTRKCDWINLKTHFRQLAIRNVSFVSDSSSSPFAGNMEVILPTLVEL